MTLLRHTLTTFIILGSIGMLHACSNDEDTSASQTLSSMQFDAYYETSQALYHTGSSIHISMKSERGAIMATGQNNRYKNKLSALEWNLATLADIETGYEHLIKELHEEKRKVLAEINAQSSLSQLEPNIIYPARIDARKIKKDKEDCFDSNETLKSVIRYRDALVKICANSHFKNEGGELIRVTEHAIGEIDRDQLSGDENDAKYFNQLLLNVHPDDKYMLFDLLVTLTPRSGERQKFSAMDALHFICIQENRILLARKNALSLIKSRISTDSYGFDKILPIAYGPSSASPGEEVEVKIMIAAFDSSNNPKVECAQGGTIEVREGVASLRIKLEETTTLNGTISVMNKQGAVKTEAWKVQIPVVKQP